MGASEWVAIGLTLVGGVFAIVGYLLSSKDKSQEEMIKDLYEKHAFDAQKLVELELALIRNHPSRDAIKDMFHEFKNYLNERFDRIEQSVGVERRGK